MKMFILIILLNYLFYYNFLYSQTPTDTSTSDISLRTYVEEEIIPLNREVIYVVELKWEGDLSRYKIAEILEPDLTNLVVRGTGSSNKVYTNSSGNEISTKKVTFYFKPIELGMAYINGVTIRYEDKTLDLKESLLASRISVKIVEPLKEENANDLLSNLLYLGLVILMLGGGIYLTVIYNKRKKENEIKERERVKETIEEKYSRLLKKNISLSGNNYSEKLNDLSHLLNNYFSEKFSESLTNMSSDEKLKFFKQQEIRPDLLEKIIHFLEKSDLIKFAGNTISEAEFHQLYDAVEWILEKFKKENSEKEGE